MNIIILGVRIIEDSDNRGSDNRGCTVVESSSLVSVLFGEAISHPYISFFHLLVNGFSVTSFHTVSKYTGGRGGTKMVSAKKNQLISSQGPHFSPRSIAKINGKSTNLGKNGIYWYK